MSLQYRGIVWCLVVAGMVFGTWLGIPFSAEAERGLNISSAKKITDNQGKEIILYVIVTMNPDRNALEWTLNSFITQYGHKPENRLLFWLFDDGVRKLLVCHWHTNLSEQWEEDYAVRHWFCR